jgi:hypothetical protein
MGGPGDTWVALRASVLARGGVLIEGCLKGHRVFKDVRYDIFRLAIYKPALHSLLKRYKIGVAMPVR